MKTYLLLIFALFFFVNLRSQEMKPTIQVSGSAVINVKPDIMKWEISIEVYDDNLMQGKNQNDKSTLNVLNYIKEKGVSEKDVYTEGIRITKNLSTYKDSKKYTITNKIWFTINEFSLYDEMTTGLTEIECVFIKNIYLDYSKSSELRSQARTDAILAAQKKANEMASVLNASIGKPLRIDEGTVNYYYPNPFNNVSSYNYGSESNSQMFYEGQVKVEAKVSITFELVNK